MRPPIDSPAGVLEWLPDGVLLVDAAGVIVYANRRVGGLTGYAAHELIGRAVEVLVPDSARAGHVAHRAAFAAGPATREMGARLGIRARRKDGSEFPADISLSPVEGPAGPQVVVTLRDVTERQLAEEALHESRERLQRLVEGITDHAIVMFDVGGLIASWTPAAQSLFGYSEADILGRPSSVLYPARDRAAGRPAQELAAAAATGRHDQSGWRLRKDGGRFWAEGGLSALTDTAGKLRGYSVVLRDDTERKRSRDRIEAAHEVTLATLAYNSTEDVFALIARKARSLAGAALVGFATPVGSGDELLIRVATGRGAAAVKGWRIPMAGSHAGRAFRGGRTVHALAGEGDRFRDLPLRLLGRYGTVAFVPLAVRHRSVGVLILAGPAIRPAFGERELALVHLFAAQAAVAVDYTIARGDRERLAVVEDRERIARELHDGAIQALFGMGMDLQGAAAMTADAELERRLEGAVSLVDEVIRDLRNYIFELRPGILTDRRLDDALVRLAGDFQQRTGVEVAIEIDPGAAADLSRHADNVVQLANEALSNVGRHSGARHCSLRLVREDSGIVLSVEDDGRGFDPAVGARSSGFGLQNMYERARKLGAALEIDSAPDAGTRVRVGIRG